MRMCLPARSAYEVPTGNGCEAGRRWLRGRFWVFMDSRKLTGSGMDILWPGSVRKAACNTLRQALHAARGALTADPAEVSRFLALGEETLVLCPDGSVWVYVESFKQAASPARRSREPTAHEAALDL